MENDRFLEIVKIVEKTLELIGSNKIEEAYHSIYKLNQMKSYMEFTDSERVLVIFTQAAYFSYYNQQENVEECYKEILKQTPSCDFSYFYFSLACLQYSKMMFNRKNNFDALKIAEVGFKHLRLCKDSETSLDLLQNYKNFVDFIEKQNDHLQLIEKSKYRFSTIEPKRSVHTSKIINESRPIVLPTIPKKSNKNSTKPGRNSYLKDSRLKVLDSIYISNRLNSELNQNKQVKRDMLNKSVQHYRKSVDLSLNISEYLKCLTSRFKILLIKSSDPCKARTVKVLEALKQDPMPRSFPTRILCTSLPPIPEIS